MTIRAGRRALPRSAGPAGPAGRGAPRRAPVGSTARRTPGSSAGSGTTERPRRATVTSRALILLLVVAVLGVSYASSIRAGMNQRNELSSLSTQVAQSRAAIHRLERARARWHDPAYIEREARLRFGWVMPGERTYRVIGRDGRVWHTGHDRLGAGSTASAAASSDAWWSGAVQSFTASDRQPPSRPHRPDRTPAHRIGLPSRAPHTP